MPRTPLISLKIVDFELEMARVAREVNEQAGLEIGERIDYATSTLKVVTPVDTGKARSGWTNRKFRLNGVMGGSIDNPVEYIDALNRGHSRQAPKYFIESVLSQIGLLTP